jgi:catechol 2,3-dioxygenase-like lactoylglutathione lyase family enzyme
VQHSAIFTNFYELPFMPIGRLDHYSIRTLDLAASERFYTQIMGFQVGPRPPFKFPGIWLYNGAPQPGSNGVVHIIGIDLNDMQGLVDYLGDVDIEKLKDGTGTLDHIAFLATGRDELVARCAQHGVVIRERTVPSLGLHQVFMEDPSGVTIELNYPASEAPV